MATLPGVRAAAGGRLPFDEARSTPLTTLVEDGRTDTTGSTVFRSVSPGHFQTLGIPLVAGRLFSPDDTAQAPRVAVASDSLARRLWPGQSPIGRRVRVNAFEPFEVEIMGVVGSVRETSLASDPGDPLYIPTEQSCERKATLLVRTLGDPLGSVAPVKRAVWEVAGDVSVHGLATMERTIADSVAPQRLVLRLVVIMGALALALAASPAQVAWRLVGRAMACVGVGIAWGGPRRRARRSVRLALGRRAGPPGGAHAA